MRAFADGYYTHLKRMYDYFGIQYSSPRFIYTLSSIPRVANDEIRPYFIHSSNNHQMPPLKPESLSLGSWFVQLIYLILCYYWFTACCFLVKPKIADESGSSMEESFRNYLERISLPRYYVKHYLLPLMSCVTTCPHDALLDFPARDLIEYEKRTFRRQHYTIVGGVRKLETKLSNGLKVRFLSTVTAVQNIGAKVKVTWRDEADDLGSTMFDHVIMAVTPDVVGSIFSPLQSAMAAVPTTQVSTVVHYDSARLYGSIQSVKGRVPFDRDGKSSQPIHMCSNTAATESTHEHPSLALITTSPVLPIHPEKILHRVTFTRVLRTPTSRQLLIDIFDPKARRGVEKAQKCWRNGDGNVWFVGGWCWDGMVMLEGCIASAMHVADSLGIEVPW